MNLFITLEGMARWLSANGDFKKVMEYAYKALPLAPNDVIKQTFYLPANIIHSRANLI